MQVYLTLVRRELGSYFASLVGYVVISAVLVLLGLSFTYLLESLNDKSLDLPVTELFYNTYYFWYILLLTVPVITMRTFALEKSTGTFETLMTTPVNDWTVVLAKFTGAFLFYLATWLPLLGCVSILQRFTNDPSASDPGVVATSFTGLALVGALYVSLGCFASSLTRSQIIAAMTSFAMGMAIFLMSFFAFLLPPQTNWQVELFRHISLFEHMQDFVRGVVDSRAVIFYTSLTVWFLFLTTRVVESRRWK
jgi:ABC-2 type transport system permease protein